MSPALWGQVEVHDCHLLTCYPSCGVLLFRGASWVAQLVKNPPAMQETPVQFLGWEDPLEKG